LGTSQINHYGLLRRTVFNIHLLIVDAKYSCKEAICKELVIFKTSGEEISHKSYNFIIEILGIAFLNRGVILIYDNYGVCPVVLIEHSGEVLKGSSGSLIFIYSYNLAQ
jgi:hypothetical protein